MATPSWEDESIGTDVAAAGRLVSDRITRDVGRAVDLEEALEASRYASHPYSSPPKEWPPFIEVVDTRNLPSGLIDRYNSAGGEGTALCGLFPEIRRAWASVDNSLFLWRFDKWDGQCPEYSCEEQAICAVGLVKAKPGIFVEAIQYLLMLATPIELILVGVCCSTSGDGTDPYAEITLQCLPEYTVSLDGVTMTCITCTDEGRIFLAGRDSHIYEVQYSTGSGWQKRCRKICHTSGLGSFASRWLVPNVLNFGLVDPVVAMVVDNERHILYARTQESKIQVFDLGINGDGPVKRIAEEKNLVDKRDISYGISQPSASRTSGRTSKPSIVSFAPLSSLESKWLHLVAVLSDGRRMYLSTSSAAGGGGSLRGLPALSTANQRPCLLKVVAVRPSPSVGVGSGLSLGAISVSGRPHAEDLVLKLDMSYYSSGIFVLSDSSPSGMSCLLVVNRDPCSQSSGSNAAGAAPRNVRALRETVSSLPVEGRMLAIADLLPPPITSATVYSLYAESCGIRTVGEPFNRACAHLWALGDLATQHILPRRKIVIFSTMGIMEVVFNRPVDILRRLLESNTPRSLLEDFFNRFGAGEAAAMCLLLAAKLMSTDDVPVSNIVSEKAMEAFEDSRLVGVPQVDGSGALSNTVTTPVVGFNMGQVVQEAEPVFSGAHEGLCLCTSRLLVPVWEFPVAVVKNDGSSEDLDKAIIASRLSAESLIVLETKIRLLEQLLRSRRNQKRGLYGCISGLGDITGSILYGASRVFQESSESNPFGGYVRNMEGGSTSNKRPRLPFSPAELAAMEVRAMECIRRLLRRSAEALFLIRILVQHHIARLIQTLDVRFRQKLVHLTFQQLVCSDEGEELATRLIAALMEYYIGPEGRGTVDDISGKLREGCPSYYRDSDYKFFQAVECIERAAAARTMEERESLAKEAFDLLLKIPESADLQTVCKRFEELRFYEAVVRLPLQKAQALDPAGNAFNGELDASSREQALSVRHQCYEIITDALHSLKSESGKVGARFGSSSPSSSFHLLDQASRDKYIRQIVQLGVQYPDKAFHEYLYAKMIEFGLENELLEFGGQDLVPFLQNAGRGTAYKSETIPVPALTPSPVSQDKSPLTSQQVKYLELLARYYILKKQHMLAAFILLRLAERHNFDREESLTLEQRYQFLTTALLQAKSSSSGSNSSLVGHSADGSLLELLEGKLAVLRFQMKIKQELEALAVKVEGSAGTSSGSPASDTSPQTNVVSDDNIASAAKDKAVELSLQLKGITQLYNDYAAPFELWESCLEIISFANYEDSDASIVRDIWARLLDQAIQRGGIAEACRVLKRIGSQFYHGEGSNLPLDTICIHLETAALERWVSGIEPVGDEDVAHALLAACKGAIQPVLNAYDQILSNIAVLPSADLRLRLLRSVLVVLREWEMMMLAKKLDTRTSGASLIFGGRLSSVGTGVLSQGIRDKIANAANRYMTEVHRLALPQSKTREIYAGFREIEEKLIGPL